ncbi:MAG TPA: spermidine/putrescine ABC transporter substrate-binding protein [Geminicoccus sp.]|jgi:spermidine/putrescine transport system substrate-binding protein|uniref:ABC transporter substrate-binding protein n=1 Tax=Geminicoccus sp. TaxID=2024832 RepID=UPI002E35412C|nr:spermidine/putrescine ABC transporter substrate-binding protein [Geminicoccus sp.]HEX2526484.1 spermidine/putrescine ABC transporter substrate-binding protein [Geminicoccus sp.]
MDRKAFLHELRRWQKGSVSRRHFFGVTGLGTATAVLGTAMPGLRSRPAHAADLGSQLALATWPNYHNQANLDQFTADTGVAIQLNAFGSNEEMLAKLQAGGTGWDVLVPTNYTISTYAELGLIEPLDLSKLPNFDPATNEARFMAEGTVDGVVYAVPKNWGTTGFLVNTAKLTKPLTSWKEFWDVAQAEASGRVMVHDYQLTTIGNALIYFGYSFNSVDPKELADAEKLLLDAKPHLFAISSDYQPSIRSEDAWMTVCWTGDATQLRRDMPELSYVLGKEGGEIWSDFFAIPKEAPNKAAAYAFIDFLQTPAINAEEVEAHGYPPIDSRAKALLPQEMVNDPVLYPAADLLSALEFGAAATLTDPNRAEIMARFKAA